jgi:hypothetical protein
MLHASIPRAHGTAAPACHAMLSHRQGLLEHPFARGATAHGWVCCLRSCVAATCGEHEQLLSCCHVSWLQHKVLKNLLAQSAVVRLALDAVPGPKTYEFAQQLATLAFVVTAHVPLHEGCMQVSCHIAVTAVAVTAEQP